MVWKQGIDKVDLKIRSDEANKKLWYRFEEHIISSIKRCMGDICNESKKRSDDPKYPIDLLYSSLIILETDQEKIQIFTHRNWDVEWYKKAIAKIVITCKDKISYENHQAIILAVQHVLEDFGIGSILAAGEIFIDTYHKAEWLDFIHHMIPRSMNIQDAHYWNQHHMEPGFDHSGSGGYFNWPDQPRQIAWYEKEIPEAIRYRIELRMKRRYLANHMINTPEQLIIKAHESLKRSIALRQFDLKKILKLRAKYKKAGRCTAFTKPPVREYRQLIKLPSSEVQYQLTRRLKGHLTPDKIRDRLSIPLEFPSIMTIHDCNNYNTNIPIFPDLPHH